jgi:hypothetical protein
MSLTKKRKANSECRIFQEKWTDKYYRVSVDGKALCLICSESIAVLKDYITLLGITIRSTQKRTIIVSVFSEDKKWQL